MVQTIIISVSISCVVSAVFTLYVMAKNSKALGKEIAKMFAQKFDNSK